MSEADAVERALELADSRGIVLNTVQDENGDEVYDDVSQEIFNRLYDEVQNE